MTTICSPADPADPNARSPRRRRALASTAALLGLIAAPAMLGACSSPASVNAGDAPGSLGEAEQAAVSTTCVTIQRGTDGSAADTTIADNVTFPGWGGTQRTLAVDSEDEALLWFDLSEIPQNATVTSATLDLTTTTEYSNTILFARQALASWTEGTASFGSFNQQISTDTMGHMTPAAANTTYAMTLKTSVIQGWVDGSVPNDGLALETMITKPFHWQLRTSFDSSEATTVASRPSLQICYTPFDYCAANPCQNGATCDNGASGYTCSCAPGFSGTDCEVSHLCDDVTCNHTGPCIAGGACDPSSGQCNYTISPDGTPCQIPTNPYAHAACSMGTCNVLPPKPPVNCSGATWGDPHIVTWDGLIYDLQSAGEFVLATDNQGFTVQARMEAAGADVSYLSAVATQLGGHNLSFSDQESPPLRIDGVPTPVPPEGIFFSDGSRVDQVSATSYQISYAGGQAIVIDTNPGIPNRPLGMKACSGNPQQVGGGFSGLLGNGDGSGANDLTSNGGGTLSAPLDLASLSSFANSWRVTPQTSLFYYAPGTSTATYQNTSFPGAHVSAASLSASAYAAGQSACAAAGVTNPYLLDACILDVGVTGDPAWAAMSANAPLPSLAFPFASSVSQELPINMAGATGCEATDVNDSGLVVGFCTVSGNQRQGFTWIGGVTTPLPTPPGGNGDCWATGVNASGQASGTCSNNVAARWEPNGQMLVVQDMWTSEAINDAGDMAGTTLGYVWLGSGWFYGGPVPAHYHSDTNVLENLGYHNSYPPPTGSGFALDQAGHMAGQFGLYVEYFNCGNCRVTQSRVPRGFRETPAWEWLGAPYYYPSDGLQSATLALNDNGVGAGWVQIDATWPSIPQKAIVWPAGAGSFYTWVPLVQGNKNWGISHDINNDGVVVGEYQDVNGMTRAFIWRTGTPATADLPAAPGATGYGAKAMTQKAADGTITVVGWSTSGGVRRPAYWRLPSP